MVWGENPWLREKEDPHGTQQKQSSGDLSGKKNPGGKR